MRAVHTALTKFWGGFSYNGTKIPAYLTGHVPDKDVNGEPAPIDFPYITFDVQDGSSFSSGTNVGIIWCQAKSGLNVNAQRADIMDQIAAAVPPGGKRLSFPGGYIILNRNRADFQTYYDDPEDKSVIGGRTSFEVRYFHA